MKAKLFFILCLCTLSMKAWASLDIIEAERSPRVWSLYREYYSFADRRWEHRTDHYFFEKDTTISGKVYRKVFWREEGDWRNYAPAGYALREDGDRVYVYDYGTGKEYVLFDFSLKKNDILAVDWIKETDTRKNPVFRVLAVGDTTMAAKDMFCGWWTRHFHYLKVYDTVHQITDMWLTGVGSVSHGIAWHRDFGASLDTLETVLCINGGRDYKNPECSTCYIPQVEPEYVHCRGRLILVYVADWCSPLWDYRFDVLAIQWGELTLRLCSNMDWGFGMFLPFRVKGVKYNVGDSVELEGFVSPRRGMYGELYYELELEGDAPPVVSIERQKKSELKLIPNPAKETITLSAAGCKLQRVEILDVNGHILYASALNDTDSFRYNVSRMPSGIYLARVQTPCGVLTEKFSVRQLASRRKFCVLSRL